MSIIERPEDGYDRTPQELQYRLDQQAVLAEFGKSALECRDHMRLLDLATRLSAKGMRADLSKVLEYMPDRNKLLLRAGVGWKPGVVGCDELAIDLESPAGYAFKTGEAVISNQLGQEERFRTPDVMAEHGVTRAINVLIEVGGKRYGVLEVDSREDGQFEEADLVFMRGFASLLGVAIERQQAEQKLELAIQHQQLLTREASHRVKNSLSLVSAMLSLQMRAEDDPRVSELLGDALGRITTIARAHDMLWKGNRIGMVALDELICDLAHQLVDQAPDHDVSCSVAPIEMSADRAIPVGLILTELVTNAMKYAYGGRGGPISVTIGEQDGILDLVVADQGAGLPDDFSFSAKSSASLGTRMVASLAKQVGGTLSIEDNNPGARVRLRFPRGDASVSAGPGGTSAHE